MNDKEKDFARKILNLHIDYIKNNDDDYCFHFLISIYMSNVMDIIDRAEHKQDKIDILNELYESCLKSIELEK